ncbi:hypothetical protein GXW82_32980 [Streptacidiphilus sp. 4-A2]|nr:hypothetical protein [Streptacidiphilus sp. 4-A2]
MLARCAVDRVEEWEFPLSRRAAAFAAAQPLEDAGRRRPPLSFLTGALAELRGAFGGTGLRCVLAIPSSIRPRRRGWFGARAQVCAPAQVLALADGMLVHWVDVLGVRARLPLRDLSAIVDETEHDHRCLTLITSDRYVRVRYAQTSWRQVRTFLGTVSRLAGHTGQAFPDLDTARAVWWHGTVPGDYAGPQAGTVSGFLPGRWRPDASRRCMVMVTDEELVLCVSPLQGSAARRGPQPIGELVYVVRGRLGGISRTGRGLLLQVGGTTVEVALGRRIRARVLGLVRSPSTDGGTGSVRSAAAEDPRPAGP